MCARRSTRAKNAAPSVDKKVLTPAQMAELRQDAAKARYHIEHIHTNYRQME
jgi:hypothetical protein